ncbi:[Pyruvate dehydrogenase (acetyl-transferring)] kinase, mitochondrial [Tetrabaena socialis]|uniref:Protein-serine/threonine kinase n=1 Tax=Tetrabaena socialis TaxID=47790 RepID=A0A2J7ZSL2_9CHLO|nr:[Pyruvate dehydrogenase (acetyl-transferring)] kinase, mitochondrial [Tetrabaena socialis]|eukprot:PNH03238.1 [Pyruvate dehydrogenase (acetyl-transferring)] kinase, mitochondrial [Tetrabaena socialis]
MNQGFQLHSRAGCRCATAALAAREKLVRDWYVDSFRELRSFPGVRDAGDELKFTELLRSIYRRHANAVPVMAKGVGELREELRAQQRLTELPEIHQFLDGFYLSRIGIRILIGGPGGEGGKGGGG